MIQNVSNSLGLQCFLMLHFVHFVLDVLAADTSLFVFLAVIG
jgi:hypothetical protein